MKITRDTLYMKYPSAWWHDLWREGIVGGNGIIGTNVYGGVKKETLMLTHHDLWHAKQTAKVPDVSGAFIELRKKMDAGCFKEAGKTITEALERSGYHSELESPLPLSDLNTTYNNGQGFADYRRWMQMDTGETGCKWRDQDTVYHSYQFVSRADDMVVKEIHSSNAELDIEFSLDMHFNQGSDAEPALYQHILESKKTTIAPPFMIYTACNDDGLQYGTVLRIVTDGGWMEVEKSTLHITGCKKVTIFAKVFVKSAKESADDQIVQLQNELLLCKSSYEHYLKRHTVLHEAAYRSASFELFYEGEHSNEELLLEAFEGKQSPELVEKLWKYGRYLFISGCCAESNPFPMYGLWGGDHGLPWGHNMANINIQMIYWHSFVGNLLEHNKSLMKYYNDRTEVFRDNAKKLFGLDGIYITAGTTPGIAEPTQIVPVIINWVSAAGWLAQHYYLYYLYTDDKTYLIEHILPFMEETAAFYESFVTYYEDGSIKFYPSVSPENTPQNFMPEKGIAIPHPMPTTINSTMDLAILKEFFGNLCTIAKQEGLYEEKISVWEKILNSIGEYKISKDGGIREWQDERFDERYDHRHLSHIYPVFPGLEVNSIHKKELLPAFKKAVELRKMDAQTGWSLANMGNIYARLEEGEKAMESLTNMTKCSVLSNFLTVHNDWRGMNISVDWDPSPIQLDANMGFVNAIQEMIIYSSKDLLKLLPALPACMEKGAVKSFRYISGTIDMEWDIPKKYFECRISALRPHTIVIQLPNKGLSLNDYCIYAEEAEVIRQEDLLQVKFELKGGIVISLEKAH